MSQKQYKYSAPAMLSVIAIISTLSVVLHIRSTSEDYHSETRQTSQQPKRVAIVRPFSPRRAAAITQTFDAWNEYSPCQPQYPDLDSGDTKHEIPIRYDLFLSYSQAYNGTDEAARKADQSTQYLMDNFESFPWSTCFQNVYRIEMNIPKNEDLYLPAEKDNPLWVNGPNQQFLRGMEIIKHHHHKVGNDVDTSTASYDYVVVMESDVTPIKPNWLVDLIREANENEFCMLGSKYAGDAWDLFRSSLPLALQHHLNGNAVYNLHHPLMQFLLQQLWDERGTIYKAVPYDYRISQILVQGFLGVEPDLPPGIMSKKDFAFETRDDKARTRKFENMWNEYGTVDGEAVMRESKVIQNFVGSALLPRQLKAMDASLVHGAMLYSGWEDYKYDITLVVSEWHDEMATNLLTRIDGSNHPFSAIELVVPRDLPRKTLHRLKSIETAISVLIDQRKNGVGDFDLCSSNVQSEWLMITNSYHTVGENVDLLFNAKGKFVIPFTSATDENCFTVPACRDILEMAKELFNVEQLPLVRDQDMVFHTETLKEFCHIWTDAILREHDEVKQMHMESMGVLSSAYMAFLSSNMQLVQYYELSILGGFKHFNRIVTLDEELGARYGETVLANRLLRQSHSGFNALLQISDASDNMGSSRRDAILAAPSLTRLSPPQPSPDGTVIKSRVFGVTNQPSISSAPSVSIQPSDLPSLSSAPSESSSPSDQPSDQPSQLPSLSSQPSMLPSVSSAPSISASPTVKDSDIPSMSGAPSSSSTPTVLPSISSAPSSSASPTAKDSDIPSMSGSPSSSSAPSVLPSISSAPSSSASPTTTDSVIPSMSGAPSSSSAPTVLPSISSAPSISASPTVMASDMPSMSGSPSSSYVPSTVPSISSAPSSSTSPTAKDSDIPSMSGAPSSSSAPSTLPSISSAPSLSASPTAKESVIPSMSGSPSSSSAPSTLPSISIAPSLSASPTAKDSEMPSISGAPSSSSAPSTVPSISSAPSSSASPTVKDSDAPSMSGSPSSSSVPSVLPSISSVPSSSPSASVPPSTSPSATPSTVPSLSQKPTAFVLSSTSPTTSSAPSKYIPILTSVYIVVAIALYL